MIAVHIPGSRENIKLEYLVADFNGTLAINGRLIDGVRELFLLLSDKLKIHIVTSDTYGSAAKELRGVDCTIKVLNEGSQDYQKGIYIAELGKDSVVAIGNGSNDRSMLSMSAIGIAVIQQEGASVTALTSASIVCNNIHDAFRLLLEPEKLVGTLKS